MPTVMPSKKTTGFEIPYSAGTDAPPDVATLSQKIAERVNAVLTSIKGDATLATDGTLTVGAGKIVLPKLKTVSKSVFGSVSAEGTICSIPNLAPGIYLCTCQVKAAAVVSHARVSLKATSGKTTINGVDAGNSHVGAEGTSAEVTVRSNSVASENEPGSAVISAVVQVLEEDTLSASAILQQNTIQARLTVWGITTT